MAHTNHGGGSSSSASPAGGHAMIPYFHFAGGDSFYFEAWQPTSPGTLAAACLGLVVLSLIDRWLAATRGVFAMHWKRKAMALATARDQAARRHSISPASGSDDSEPPAKTEVKEVGRASVTSVQQGKIPLLIPRTRTIPPFIWAHDLPRGALYALQVLISYLLMLAVMTFQAAYLISIVLGLGIGEVFFGRLVIDDHVH